MGELRPENGAKKQRREEYVDAKKYEACLRLVLHLHKMPYQCERCAPDQRTDEQVGAPYMEGRIAFINYVYPEEQEKPHATDEKHQGAYVPQDWQEGWCIRSYRISKHHHDGCNHIEKEAVQHQQVRGPSVPFAELAGHGGLYDGSGRQGRGLHAAKPPLCES
ncbi:MAG: hypothetical protein ACYCP0_08430, partial [Acidiferrobacteraceae bacterium]